MWNKKVFSDPQDEETWTWNPTRTWPWIIQHEENPAYQAQAPDMIKSNRLQWKIVSPCVNRAVFPNPEPSSTPRQCDQCVARTRATSNQPRPQSSTFNCAPEPFSRNLQGNEDQAQCENGPPEILLPCFNATIQLCRQPETHVREVLQSSTAFVSTLNTLEVS